MSFVETIKNWLTPAQPLGKETLHYQTPPDAENQYRLHLRIEEDGRGLLIINAATVLHLNQTAAEHARLLIQGLSAGEAADAIARRYRVSREDAKRDFQDLREHITTLATTVDLDPVTYLDIERTDPFSAETSAPYRVDLALTYRLDKTGTLDPEARRRVDRELSGEEWQQVMRKLWDVGVPHVCFTGGEPTLRDDLVQLIRYGEDLGQVTGLLTNGRHLEDQDYLDKLLLAGLDHLQITLCSQDAETHDAIVGQEGAWDATVAGLRNAIDGDIYVVAHLLVTLANADSIVETVAYIADQDVPALALSSPVEAANSEKERERLEQALGEAEEAAHRNGLRLVWDLAAPYTRVNPVEAESGLSRQQVIRQHLYVEPDGDALPAQGYNVVLGNLLEDEWETIWRHPEREKLS